MSLGEAETGSAEEQPVRNNPVADELASFKGMGFILSLLLLVQKPQCLKKLF